MISRSNGEVSMARNEYNRPVLPTSAFALRMALWSPPLSSALCACSLAFCVCSSAFCASRSAFCACSSAICTCSSAICTCCSAFCACIFVFCACSSAWESLRLMLFTVPASAFALRLALMRTFFLTVITTPFSLLKTVTNRRFFLSKKVQFPPVDGII